LLVTDFFEPFDSLAVQHFGHCNMRHGGRRRCAMPVLVSCRAPDHIAGADDPLWLAPTLRPTCACGDDQYLPQRMRVPRAARAWLERHQSAANPAGFAGLSQRIDTHGTGEVLLRPFL